MPYNCIEMHCKLFYNKIILYISIYENDLPLELSISKYIPINLFIKC